MPRSSKGVIHSLWSLLLLGVVLSSLVACGGSAPTVIVVVTNTFTPEPQVQVVTATFTATPEVVPTATPLPEPTATLKVKDELTFINFEHSSGSFSLDIPQDSEYAEDEDGAYYKHDDSLIMVIFTELDARLDQAAMETLIPDLLDQALVGEGLISSYSDLEMQVDEDGGSAAAAFNMTSETIGDGQGALAMWQVEQTLYILILLTPDYDGVEEVWKRAIESLRVFPAEAPAPPSPTDTPLPPKPTAKPTAKPTSAPPPPANANKGCYLFENQLGAEVTVTFTAQDWQWSDSFKIAANGTKEYCLDPGRYTYTIDAPPPWGSTNGDLVVNAGDRYRWPIRGQ